MKTFRSILLLLLFSVFLTTSVAIAADAEAGPARIDGEWKLDWDRSDSFEPVMEALETPWLMRRLAGIARARTRADGPPSTDIDGRPRRASR